VGNFEQSSISDRQCFFGWLERCNPQLVWKFDGETNSKTTNKLSKSATSDPYYNDEQHWFFSNFAGARMMSSTGFFRADYDS
jgi:hypothetical protein